MERSEREEGRRRETGRIERRMRERVMGKEGEKEGEVKGSG